MKNRFYCRFTVCIIGALLIVLSGCASSRPSKFYTLDSMKAQETLQRASLQERSVYVTVGPVEIPDYLDRPQIVARTSQNELTVAEFDRWAGSLREDITRVLIENLSILLSSDRMLFISWKPVALAGKAMDYRIGVDVTRFDVMHNGDVLLTAKWGIAGKDGKSVLLMRDSRITEPFAGQDYDVKVAAMSRALEKLSREIAQGIKSVTQSK